MNESRKVLVVVPAYNEAGTVRGVVEEILALGDDSLRVLVVDDGSTDQTRREAARCGVWVASHVFNLGIGGAVQTGFKWARQNDFDVVVQVDGDGQHDPRYLKELLGPLGRGEADLVVGSRFIPPYSDYQSSLVRRLGIHFFARLISLLTRCRVTDPTSGFRACNKKMIRLFAEYYPQDFPEPEAIAMARRYRARVKEVPVQMRPRGAGQSSIRYLNTLYYMIKVTLAVMLDRLKRGRTL